MEEIRRAIRVGRRQFRRGQLRDAIAAWKDALARAYDIQDFAAMFVLTKNLGDANVQLTKRLTTAVVATEQVKLLTQAVAYYQYALDVVGNCALQERLVEEDVILRQSIQCVEMKRKQVATELEWLETREKSKPVSMESCTTCSLQVSNLILDENDGCLYCQQCYDEYYSTMEEVEHIAAMNREPGLEEEEEGINSSPKGIEWTQSAIIQMDSTEHILEYAHVDGASTGDVVCEHDQRSHDPEANTTENVPLEREEHAEIIQIESANTSSDTSAATLSQQSENGGWSHNERETQQSVPEKRMYSIATLLSLREMSLNQPCPAALLSSFVRNQDRSLFKSRKKANDHQSNLTRAVSPSAVSIDASMPKMNRASLHPDISSIQQTVERRIQEPLQPAEGEEEANSAIIPSMSNQDHMIQIAAGIVAAEHEKEEPAVPCLRFSALPSIDLCQSMRAAREQQGGEYSWSIEQIANSLFDKDAHADGGEGRKALMPIARQAQLFAQEDLEVSI